VNPRGVAAGFVGVKDVSQASPARRQLWMEFAAVLGALLLQAVVVVPLTRDQAPQLDRIPAAQFTTLSLSRWFIVSQRNG
jgi:hypothetical protein